MIDNKTLETMADLARAGGIPDESHMPSPYACPSDKNALFIMLKKDQPPTWFCPDCKMIYELGPDELEATMKFNGL